MARRRISIAWVTYHNSQIPDISTTCPTRLEKDFWGAEWLRLNVMIVWRWHIAKNSSAEVADS